MDYILSVIYFNDEKSMLSLSNKPIGFTYVLLNTGVTNSTPL